jgi:hypothetical protein
MPRAWLCVALALCTGCRSRPAEAEPQACAPTTATLAADASAAGLAGTYRLRLIASSGPQSGKAAEGELRLLPLQSGGSAGDAADPFVLHGAADLDLAAVGAPEAELTSTNPTRPGVLVMQLAPTKASKAPRIMLRLGAEANRRDVTPVEGAYTVLRLSEISEGGFAGSWESGAPMPVAGGYFCATRVANAEG